MYTSFQKGEIVMICAQLKKPYYRWLFGGLGFHNSEATMLPIMSEKFRDEKVYKVFRELEPGFSRVFAGYADWTEEAIAHFAEFYENTFRLADTTLYLVPGRMPLLDEDEREAYVENVAQKLDALINRYEVKKARYYCVTNELSVGNKYSMLSQEMELFREYHRMLWKAFRKYGLHIGLLATDVSGFSRFHEIDWAMEHMDQQTEHYCGHNYATGNRLPGDPTFYPYVYNSVWEITQKALKKEKRFILGEFGLHDSNSFNHDVMRNDIPAGFREPAMEAEYALMLAEYAMAAMNAGSLAMAFWSMVDYPDPMLCEWGESPEAQARYEVSRFSGHGLGIRYNKNGLIRWEGDMDGECARPALYTYGPMVRYFRKGSRILEWNCESDVIRGVAAESPEGNLTAAVLSWSEREETVTLMTEHPVKKVLRCFVFEAANVPEDPFCDLPKWKYLAEATENGTEITVMLPPKSMVLLTEDYEDRVPPVVENVTASGAEIRWDAAEDALHRYYRVYENGVQIGSTVACRLEYPVKDGMEYQVHSVDRYGNEREK